MADNIIGDIYSKFDSALSGFYEGAATGISNYVIPIAWVLLGICMLICCYLIIEGKVAMPMATLYQQPEMAENSCNGRTHPVGWH